MFEGRFASDNCILRKPSQEWLGFFVDGNLKDKLNIQHQVFADGN